MTIFNNKKITALLLSAGIFSVAVLSSCKKDVLNTVPQTKILEEAAFSTPQKILAQVNNLYGQMQNASFYGGRFIVFNEQRGDEFGQNDGNAATGSAVWNQAVAPSTEFVNNVWTAGYAAIDASNILISNLGNTTVISDSLRKNYIAEAKFVRALCYLSLVQTYAKPYLLDKTGLGVPLRLTPITAAGSNDIARNSIEDVYAQIISDLNDAETDLPTAYASAALNTSRAHKSTAIALKSRVYLVQGDYENVIAEASKLVPAAAPYQYTAGSLIHKLETSIATVFGGSYTGAEMLFSIPFANSTTETPPAQSSLAYTYAGQPILFLNKTGIMTNPALSSSSDARAALIGTNAASQKILKKFAITTAPFRDYVPVIRYAEVMLNYAEAAANNNDLTTAAALLKAVRNRSDASYVFADADINTKDALINSIITERRIEFLGEGFRLADLQRRLQTLPSKAGTIGTAPEVLITGSNYIWPIPSTEMSANTLMVQNP